MTAPEAPIRGTITSWQPDDSIGRITLATGEEVRFGHSACVGMRPAVGAEVWVVELAPHPLGGRRAKVVNATGGPATLKSEERSSPASVWTTSG